MGNPKAATVEDDEETLALQRPTSRRPPTPPSHTQAPRPANTAPSKRVSFSPPRPSSRHSSDRSYLNTVIKQKWGRLFDSEGNTTQRLGQFLRGLANYIIDVFPKEKSMVVTPSKMEQYYSSFPVDNEIHPLIFIFRAWSNEQISRLYQDLGCEHHLVQDDPNKPPTIPSLTPFGFAYWTVIHILASPNEEVQRLKQVLKALPIDADGVTQDRERLPKELPHSLFPRKGDHKIRRKVEDTINNISRPQKSTIMPSPPRQLPSAQSRSRLANTRQVKTAPIETKPDERELKQYTGASSAWRLSRNENPIEIERQRRPYIGKPRSGRSSQNTSFNAPPREPNRSEIQPPRTPSAANHRTRDSGRADRVQEGRSTNFERSSRTSMVTDPRNMRQSAERQYGKRYD